MKKESAMPRTRLLVPQTVQQNWKIVLYFSLLSLSERHAYIERVYMDKYLYRVGTVLFINDSFSAHPRYTHFRAGKGRN